MSNLIYQHGTQVKHR